MNEAVVEAIKSAPDKPGVYVFKDEEGNPLYVGKARSLKNRLRSYLSCHVPHKISVMLTKACELDIFTTDTELDAFILENNLIKTYRPPFNVMLRDDKNYPYIRIVTTDPYPYIEIIRKVERDGCRYYGPYVPTWAVRETLKTLTESFPIRRCKTDLTKIRQKRPCLNHQLGKCLAPCCGEVSREEYLEVVNDLIRVMEGEGDSIIEKLTKKMNEAAENLEFERAARFRDRIFSIKRILERQRMLLHEKINMDVMGVAQQEDTVCVAVVFIRKGMVIGEKEFVFEEASKEEAIDAFLREFYGSDRENSSLLLTSEFVPEHWSAVLGVEVVKPKNSQHSQVIDFAESKAQEHLKEFLEQKRTQTEVLHQAKVMLGLSRIPLRIEGYDISNIQGQEAVGSMVVFEMGKPTKFQYRRFRIKGVFHPDDYSMHEEVMKRRVRHLDWRKPDLILIDGGMGQLNRVVKVLEEVGWDMDVLAISKDRDRDHIWNTDGEISIPKDHPVYHLLQRVRDESHRFALSYHRRLRRKRTLEGVIEGINGIGPVRKTRILKFIAENPEYIYDPKEMAKSCGIPIKVAEKVVELLKEYYQQKGVLP